MADYQNIKYEQDENGHGWCLIPPYVAYRQDISATQKLVFGRIFGLTSRFGYFYAHNKWLGKQLGIRKETASKAISNLQKKGLLNVVIFKDENNQVIYRHIYVNSPQPPNEQPSYPPIVSDSIGGGSDSIGGVPQSRMNSGVEAPFQGGSIDYSIDSLDNNNTIVSSLSKHTIGNETKVSLPMETTACAVRGRGSSETPCSASAGIGWRSKSKGKTSSPEPHDSPDSLRKTESSFPENISSLAPDNISVLTPIIDDSEHFQNSDVSDIIPEEKMDSSPIKPVLSTVSGDDNIPPVQVKNRDNFKIRNSYNGAESKEIIDHWNSTGLKFLDSKYKSSVTNYLTDIMNGTFFDDKPWLKSPSKAFGKHEIMAAIDNRAMAAIDVNYSPIDPVRKKAMRDLPMWLWLYNPSTRKSQFLNNLKPPKPSYRQPNLIEDEQPPFTAAIKAAYIKKILYGVEPVSSWSNHDENNFRRAGALLWEFVERNGKRIPFVYRHQYYRLAEALLDAILNDVNEDDRPSITTGWLCSDLTFNRRLPAYLGNIRMLL